jgi:hypothetical protein
MADDITREQQVSDEREEPVGIFDPLSGGSSDASQAEMTAAQSSEPRVSRGTIVAWLIGMAALGFFAWLLYLLIAIGGCSSDGFAPSFRSGGAASGGSLWAAAVLGGSLWFAVGMAAFRLRRRFGLLTVSFVGLYVVGLVVLGNVSPLIWGPSHCP